MGHASRGVPACVRRACTDQRGPTASRPHCTTAPNTQAANLATFLGSAPPMLSPVHELYVSPMQRTLMTMQGVAKATQLTPLVWADIYEIGGCHKDGQGQPGLSAAAIRTQFGYEVDVGERPEQMRDDGWCVRSIPAGTLRHGLWSLCGYCTMCEGTTRPSGCCCQPAPQKQRPEPPTKVICDQSLADGSGRRLSGASQVLSMVGVCVCVCVCVWAHGANACARDLGVGFGTSAAAGLTCRAGGSLTDWQRSGPRQ